MTTSMGRDLAPITTGDIYKLERELAKATADLTATADKLDKCYRSKVMINDQKLPALDQAINKLATRADDIADETTQRLIKHVVEAYKPVKAALYDWRQA